MNLLDALMQAQGGGAVKQLAQNFGLNGDQTTAALQQLLPALSGGLKRNVGQPGGLDSLMGALTKGHHEQYLNEPSRLGNRETVDDGNKILGHLLGSKDVSRQVAHRASQQTGIGESVLKQMLPVVASMVMGSLNQQTAAKGMQGSPGGRPSGDLMGMLAPMLDADRDGSIADDVIGMLGGFLGGRR
jgi:hypothetical protein